MPQRARSLLNCDKAEAVRFLHALDPFAARFTFQTFDDSKLRRPALAKTIEGTLDDSWERLVALNNGGAGVFVTINKTDLAGRRKSDNVVAIRAGFVDLDGASLEPVLNDPVLPKPHIVTQTSPGKWHCFFLMRGIELTKFTSMQTALAIHFRSDRSVNDLPRVMRLPGFWHCKGEPFLSRIISVTGELPYDGKKFLNILANVTASDATAPSAAAAETKGQADDTPKGDFDWSEWQKNRPLGHDLEARQVNDLAIRQFEKWIPFLFPCAKKTSAGYRVRSADLGRPNEEDLSFYHNAATGEIGIKDFGVHDLGDRYKGGRGPISIVMQWGNDGKGMDFKEALYWLATQLGINPEGPSNSDENENDGPGTSPPGGGHNKRPKPDDYYIFLAENYLTMLEKCDEDLRIVKDEHNNEALYKYEDGIWTLLKNAEATIEGALERIAREENIKTTSKIVMEARKYILRSPNVRRNDNIRLDAHGKIPVRGHLIDPKTLKLEPLTQEHYATWTLDIEYDLHATCPWWDRALLDAFADRPDNVRQQTIALVQEMAGMSLLDERPKALSKALILVGKSNSGKSTIIYTISGLLTDRPIATSLDAIGGTHGLMEFVRRAPWTLHEAFDGGKWHASARVKAIISGDPIDINIKNGPIITKCINQPIFWGSNSPVQIREATDAVRNRIIIMECRREFKEDMLIGLGAETKKRGFEKPHEFLLKCEKSGIFNWALAGMQSAMKRGYFKNTKEGEAALDEFKQSSNLVASFLDECVTFGPEYMIRIADFSAAFDVHYQHNKQNDRFAPSNESISRALQAMGDPCIGVGKDLRDKTFRYYIGMHLNTAGLNVWEAARGKSPLALISYRVADTNRFIPKGWFNKDIVKRVQSADFANHQKRERAREDDAHGIEEDQK
ncbi:hypothetical protein JQ597_31720 [Bradyrhizobium sp. AUGA SZCCT0177]|uniref:DNA-primase RepB domain-containing protein n=1 Tax=Bradyrhizobium sp. AUGA SZCCT0177 TaxID=2807665 RepID=UPI001BA720D4|nr:DNA-primase RepB domain-containing protein [Bradyrhizobium sp. AUGA SZCCT0177]MBR1286632.1 hypothetical protein [Bradyrhizobium sp. AUGA SZCCT0177]